MAYESKALIIAIFNYVKKLGLDKAKERELLVYLQQLANADSVVLEVPDNSDGE